MEECSKCGFNDEDYGCTCYSFNKWYACPIENKKPENIQALKDYIKQKDNISLYVCDRCGEGFNETIRKLPLYVIRTPFTMDLCPKCQKELEKWWKEHEKGDTNGTWK